MSLWIYLEGPPREEVCQCSECGHEHTRIVEPAVYDRNVTHNLAQMAGEAGVYECVWRPKEHGFLKAQELVTPLQNAIRQMRVDPERFKRLNPSNGWGSYDGLLEVFEEYLAACKEYPEASVRTSG